MIHSPQSYNKVLLILVLLIVSSIAAFAQSGNPTAPTPVRNNNLLGTIAARDLGDARLTDHYYAFTGKPGDLLITVRSHNLNGDLDVFTAGSLRPLLKLTLYAESNAPITKGIYLRKREDLILRVEARSPNDDDGTYELVFGGSFEPIIGGPEIAEADTSANPTSAPPRTGKTRRVSSVGARINEPEPAVTEVAAAPTPEPTPEVKPIESPSPSPEVKEVPAETGVVRPAPARSGRSRPPAGRRSTAPTPTKPKETASASREETKSNEEPKPKEEAGEVTESENKPKPSSRSTTRRGVAAARTTPKPPPEPEPESGPRLVIETNDGTLINRPMSGVKRVTVENGQVVVTGKDGKIDRFLLANIVRMSIAP
jgi:hypothetical protein